MTKTDDDPNKVFLQLSTTINLETGKFSADLTVPPGLTPSDVHDLLCQVLHKITGTSTDDGDEHQVTLSKVH